MKIYVFLLSAFLSSIVHAKSTYVAETISTPLYSSPGTNQKITNWLLPGTKVKLLQKDPSGKYALIEWSKGKSGWIQLRKLTNLKPAIARLKIAGYQMDSMRKKIKLLEAKLKSKGNASNKPTQVASTKIDSTMFSKMNSTISTQAQSIAKLQAAIENLTQQNKALSQQIAHTTKIIKSPNGGSSLSSASGTQVDWFMWGGFVVALSFISGILITKIRWRKDRLFS